MQNTHELGKKIPSQKKRIKITDGVCAPKRNPIPTVIFSIVRSEKMLMKVAQNQTDELSK